MTKDYPKDHSKDNQQDPSQLKDSSFYDVSFDYPLDSDKASHSDSLSSNPKNSVEPPTPDNSSRWDNFHADFQEKQRQQYAQEPQEDEFSDETMEQAKKLRAVSLAEQIKTEQLEDEAAKASLMLDRSIRRVRSLFTDFDSFTPPASNPYKSDVHEALKQREPSSYKKSPTESLPSSDSLSAQTSSDEAEQLEAGENPSTPSFEKDRTAPHPLTWLERRKLRQENPLAYQGGPEETSDSLSQRQTSEPSEITKAPISTDASLESTEPTETITGPSANLEGKALITSFPSDSRSIDLQAPVEIDSSPQPPRERRYSSDLPSPEEIAQERERRRKLRIQQLEMMNSEEEIEQSYQGEYTTRFSQSKDRSRRSPDASFTPEAPLQSDVDTPVTYETNDWISDQTDSPDATISQEPTTEVESSSNEPQRDESIMENSSFTDDQPASPIEKAEPLIEPEETLEVASQFSADETEVESFIEEDVITAETSDDITENSHAVVDSETIEELNSRPESERLLSENDSSKQAPEIEKDADIDVEDADFAEELPAELQQPSNQSEGFADQAKVTSLDKEDDTDTTNSEDDFRLDEPSDSQFTDLETVAIATGMMAATKQDLDAANIGTGSPALPTDAVQAATGAELLNLENTRLPFSQRDDVAITVIHGPLDKEPESDAYEQALAEEPIVVSDLKKKKQLIYSLEGYTLKEKILFGFNVAFNVFKRIFFYIILIGILFGAMAAGAGAGFFANLVSKTPPPTHEEMMAQVNRLEQQSTLFYANGEPIANIRADVVRSVANIDGISPYIIDGLIATEDEDFFEHPGVMPKAILRAALETIMTGGGTGGSTLTQQLVKQQMLSHDVTFFRKANEILLALRLENHLTKDEILTAYLNVSPFGRNNNGDNVAGILKASEGIFGLEPDEVNLAQAAFLVGLPQDPYAYTPYDQYGEFTEDFQPGINRMHEVLFRMYREQKITQAEYESALDYDITQDFLPQEPREEQRQSYLYQAMMDGAIEKIMLLNIEADGFDWKQVYEDDEWYNEYYFAAEEELRTGGYRVYTTIDRQIYDQLQESAQAYNDQLGVTYDGVFVDPETGEEIYYLESVQTGMVVIDNRSGKVLGFVSGTDYENNQIDHAFSMRRSPGSTIKPLAVYGPAIEENLINPATIIPDTEYVQEYSDGTVWRPTNYGNVVSDTFFSARTALLRSDNIPAVRIYDELVNRGVPIIDYLDKMGFNTVDSYTEADTQNLSFALGGVENGPTVFEEARAFSTFANNGKYVDSYFIERIEDAFGNIVFQQDTEPVQVFSEDTNYLMVDMLRDTNTEGSGRTAGENLAFGGDWIAKSGISEYSKDVWYIASTPAITVGSWIGYDSQYADYTIDINDGFDREAVRSQTFWARVVNDLYALRPEIFGVDQTFAQPESVQSQTILTDTGTLPGNVTVNNRQYNIANPTREDVFKVSNPAPALTYNFMFGATDEDHQRFWTQFQQAADAIRQQQQQQPPQESSSSEESSSESTDETSSENDETPTDESTPPAENPEG